MNIIMMIATPLKKSSSNALFCDLVKLPASGETCADSRSELGIFRDDEVHLIQFLKQLKRLSALLECRKLTREDYIINTHYSGSQ